jgi:plastocyanin
VTKSLRRLILRTRPFIIARQLTNGGILMRVRVSLWLLLSLVVATSPATSASAKDVYLSISGKANGFFTDASVFNPSFDKDIIVTARYLPAGGVVGHPDNSGVTTKPLTIPKRSQVVFDDAVQSMFGGGPALGAIRLTSDDDFVATQRIYADKLAARQAGTLGQFVPGLDATSAKRKGVVIQLKSGADTLGAFPTSWRTNWGAVNPNATAANVKLKLHDKNSTTAGSEKTIVLQPFGVLSPTELGGFFGNAGSDLSDAWFSYDSDQPIFVWGSIVDNGSEDPTFVTAFEDTGVAPPAPQLATMTIVARDFEFTATPSGTLKAGAQVKFILSKVNGSGSHGIRITDSSFATIIDMNLTSTPVEQTVTLPTAGTYFFVCTNTLCDSGTGHHFDMTGEFTVVP